VRARPAADAQSRFLAVLRRARGAFVSRAELVEAMYPPGVERPASFLWAPDTAARALRLRGYPIEGRRLHGSRLAAHAAGEPLPRPRRPSGPAPTQQARMLEALRQAAGASVPTAELVEAMFPPGAERPASFLHAPNSAAAALRRHGHRISSDGGRGYSLAPEARR
jgi:hypothetical protein